uniref:Sulfhydryl oxidase n=1 Tax=Bos mutus grunniens TaxID=30521 RepID=A0A8B9YWQ0_BOSMU
MAAARTAASAARSPGAPAAAAAARTRRPPSGGPRGCPAARAAGGGGRAGRGRRGAAVPRGRGRRVGAGQRQRARGHRQQLGRVARAVLLLVVRPLHRLRAHLAGPGRRRERLGGCHPRRRPGLCGGEEPGGVPRLRHPLLPHLPGSHWDCALACSHPARPAGTGVAGAALRARAQYFKAFTKDFTTGENFKGPDRELQTVRRTMINFLQNHTDGNRPPACPSLDPIRPSDVLSLIDKRGDRYVAVLLEDDSSYVGREVILDLIPYESIEVRRALGSDTAFLQKLGVPSLPSCYLIYPNGSHGPVTVGKPLRSFFSSYLRSLPGVRKKPGSLPGRPSREESSEAVVWRDFDRSKLYTADLESGLHHLLRVELAAHRSLAGAELKTLKDFITVLAKLFPGRPPVRKLLEMLQEWLASLPLDRIPYDAVLDLVNNKMRISGIFLTNHIKWVGCQGSRPELRGYSCSLWKLFHTLTVGAGTHPKALDGTGLEDDPQAVLQTIRRYVHVFFGCKECGEHFEEMAKESIDSVKTPDQAILWLWKKHNLVNSRLAGHPSEDPKFPKVPWPSPDLCPACHEEIKGLGTWNEGQVLLFLKQHYGRDNLVDTHSADLGGPGEGAPAPGEKQEGSQAPPEQPPADHGAESLRPPSLLPPRARLSERSQPGLDLLLGSRAGGEGRRGAEAAAAFLGMGFSSLDMSLCVVLYVASSLFLMVMYFFFRVRSKRWKVKHHHPSV